ncbi:MAG: MBL fold metallo-hydrolase [Prolixibacteraceae bacterium]
MIKRMIITALLLFISAFFIGIIFHVSVQMGRKPKGERLQRILKSENYKKGIFENKQETNMDRPPIEGIKEMMKKKADQRPSSPINTLPIDKIRYENSVSDTTLITWLGHSTLLIRMNNLTIITDPVFSQRASLFQNLGPKKFDYSHEYTLEELPEIDVVVISHDHYDHLDYEAIRYLRSRVKKFITPLGVGAHLEHWGVDSAKIEEYDWWESANIAGVKFTATPGRHFTGRLFADRFKTLWCGWAIVAGNEKLYFSGDSGYFDGFKVIGERLGPFDFSFVECGQYSKYWPYIHMMPEESVQAALDVKSKRAMPIHWGKFKLSIHTWFEPPTRFIKEADEKGLEVATPKIGQTFTLDEFPVEEWWN